jgi:hypothetical protein
MCNFKAQELLELRRYIVHAPIGSEAIALIVKTIDDVRFAHQDTGCNCWQDAISESDKREAA